MSSLNISIIIIFIIIIIMIKCSWQKKLCVLLLPVLIVGIAMSWTIMFTQLKDLAEVNKCPVCYGTSLCPELFNHNIVLNEMYLLRNTINTLNAKKVLFGTMNGQKIVIKNLASDTDYENIRNIYMDTLSDSNALDIASNIEGFLSLPYYSSTIKNIRLCPGTENLMALLNVVIDKNKNDDLRSLYSYIWTSFRSNTEPLVQQVLHGWPVAHYYGSCGRLVISEFCGISLTEYAIAADWEHRSSVARQLLEAAMNFTFSHSHFVFYFTDISADNIAISVNGTAKFIDLEHVIIVDKNPKDRPQFWDHVHQSENFGIEDAFAFSADDICSHHVSDHNVYSVCREILWKKSPLLSGGLLNCPPLPLQQQLDELLESCLLPSDGLSRFHIASKLIALLV